jgi:hypothetical protein
LEAGEQHRNGYFFFPIMNSDAKNQNANASPSRSYSASQVDLPSLISYRVTSSRKKASESDMVGTVFFWGPTASQDGFISQQQWERG